MPLLLFATLKIHFGIPTTSGVGWAALEKGRAEKDHERSEQVRSRIYPAEESALTMLNLCRSSRVSGQSVQTGRCVAVLNGDCSVAVRKKISVYQ